MAINVPKFVLSFRFAASVPPSFSTQYKSISMFLCAFVIASHATYRQIHLFYWMNEMKKARVFLANVWCSCWVVCVDVFSFSVELAATRTECDGKPNNAAKKWTRVRYLLFTLLFMNSVLTCLRKQTNGEIKMFNKEKLSQQVFFLLDILSLSLSLLVRSILHEQWFSFFFLSMFTLSAKQKRSHNKGTINQFKRCIWWCILYIIYIFKKNRFCRTGTIDLACACLSKLKRFFPYLDIHWCRCRWIHQFEHIYKSTCWSFVNGLGGGFLSVFSSNYLIGLMRLC